MKRNRDPNNQSTHLQQIGLPKNWWEYSMKRVVCSINSIGKTRQLWGKKKTIFLHHSQMVVHITKLRIYTLLTPTQTKIILLYSIGF
jgi:hypothetical protein